MKAGALLATLALASAPALARADAPDPAVAVSGASCSVKGSAIPAKGLKLHDARTGGRVIAEFTSAVVPLVASDFPADPAKHRSKLVTSNGSATLRLDGFAIVTDVPVYTQRDVPVVASHVWIASATKVTLTAAASGQLTAQIQIAGTNAQVASGSAACDAFGFQRGTPTKVEVEGNARGYMTKSSTLELFSDAGKASVFTLTMHENASQLFFSSEVKNGFVHVRSRADVVLDGWVRLRDLDPLKKGELLDSLIPAVSVQAGAKLQIEGSPKLVKVSKDVTVRAKRDDKEAAIGAIESGAEVWVTETVTGWSNVLPKDLGFMAPEGQGFWVKSADL